MTQRGGSAVTELQIHWDDNSAVWALPGRCRSQHHLASDHRIVMSLTDRLAGRPRRGHQRHTLVGQFGGEPRAAFTHQAEAPLGLIVGVIGYCGPPPHSRLLGLPS